MSKKIFIALILFYQKGISPFLGAHCRYQPTCSQYTKEAIQRYGVAKGAWIGFKRICRCHPFHPGGYDPVPILKNTPKVNLGGENRI